MSEAVAVEGWALEGPAAPAQIVEALVEGRPALV
jgi:hypothetical protein